MTRPSTGRVPTHFTPMASNNPISLRVSNNKAYVWDVDGKPKQEKKTFLVP